MAGLRFHHFVFNLFGVRFPPLHSYVCLSVVGHTPTLPSSVTHPDLGCSTRSTTFCGGKVQGSRFRTPHTPRAGIVICVFGLFALPFLSPASLLQAPFSYTYPLPSAVADAGGGGGGGTPRRTVTILPLRAAAAYSKLSRRAARAKVSSSLRSASTKT